jgi:hypothetical protein
MTLIWFIVWLIADNIGDHERLSADPVNVWTATLILAIALDLGRQHAGGLGRPRSRATRRE